MEAGPWGESGTADSSAVLSWGASGGVQRETQGDGQSRQGRQAGTQGEGFAVTNSCRVVAGCSMETTLLSPPVSRPECGAYLVSSLAPSIRSALRTASGREPLHTVLGAPVSSHTRVTLPVQTHRKQPSPAARAPPRSALAITALFRLPYFTCSPAFAFYMAPLSGPPTQMTPTAALPKSRAFRAEQRDSARSRHFL